MHQGLFNQRIRSWLASLARSILVRSLHRAFCALHVTQLPARTLLKETLVGGAVVSPTGVERAETRVNSFIGNDRSRWRTDIPTYRQVSLGEVYEEIALTLKVYGKRVEKVFTVQPGGDPGAIRLRMEGATALKINEQGEIEVETGLGLVKFSKPLAYQEREGKREGVHLADVLDGDTYGFAAGAYDRTIPLVIDPVLSYSTYLGGSGPPRHLGDGLAERK